ncbi:PUCC protein [Rubidibacter lacunae KORDI 51-2]|uniref:PUCC protein n=1 Tax=Rubidibacter lacunae KORDI 51-2 TaxID=582515 RepID=U5DN74_9CHRO|nr:BCD family MFS transporter [Rubidibacter lacunae]ERN43096.1 PUCC protein [Rubidibacter lacunae KORDI 51-2]
MTTTEFDRGAIADRPPRINALTTIRLGLYQIAIGMMAVLTLAVINRVLISELGVPGTIAATLVAIPQLLASPGKIWFGQLSDAKPLFGLHRSGYVWFGAAAYGTLIFIAIQIVWQLGGAIRSVDGARAAGEWAWTMPIAGWTAVLALIFGVYGLAVNASSVPFATLLVDVTEPDERSRVVSVAWSFLMVGIVVAGIGGSKFLDRIQSATDGSVTSIEALQGPINGLFAIVPLIALGLAFAGTLGIEPKYSRYRLRSRLSEGDDLTLGRALKVLTSSRQTGFFFTFLIAMTVGLFMQEAVLEPYGGDVFGMTIAQTTQLNSFWGIGILVGLSAAGFAIAPNLGKRLMTRLGCGLVAACFIIVIAAGFTRSQPVLQGAVLLFGFSAGIATNGAIGLMLDLTAAETAGTFIGAWGLAQALARGAATICGGMLLDLGNALFSAPVLAYGLVFAAQAGFMVFAIALLGRVDATEFQESTRNAFVAAMESELD